MNILSFLGGAKEAVSAVAGAGKFIGERILPPKKMSEMEKMDKFIQVFGISEGSTNEARKMFAVELQSQPQPWLIRFLNGLVRPFGGLGSLATEFFVIWGQNIAKWFGFQFEPISLSTEQHLFLATCVAFYFGSRLKETLSGVSRRR